MSESSLQATEDTIYVALGKDVNENKLTLSWALRNFREKFFCIIHVHQLAQTIASIRTNYATSGLEEHELFYLLDSKVMQKIQEGKALFDEYEAEAAVERERKILQNTLDHYILICHQIGVHGKKLHIEMDDIGKGIVELLQRHSIKKLVMGAAANEHYSESMRYIKSKKAMYVFSHAPLSCQTWFICRGHLIYSRKGDLDRAIRKDKPASLHLLASSIAESGRLIPSRCSSSSIDSRMEDIKYELKTYGLSQPENDLHHLPTSNELVQVEHDNALEVTKGLLKKQAEASSSIYIHQFFPVFSLSEIHEATCNFDPSLKIVEQEYGSIYKGLLHHTPVTIKVLNLDSLQGPYEFQQEVNVMNKFRHPNLLNVIGACPEACALIYEYLPNGSLEDRLSCKDNTPPLSWQTRICIATDICSVLTFFHASNPQSIIHGDLKAANVLLDTNFVCKLSDFGVYHNRRLLLREELSSKSDIHAFGIILLQLLTGKSSLNIAEEMRDVIDCGNLEALLDCTAGKWPFVEAKQLAHLALRCCDIEPSKRPDLVSEAWRVLKPMRSACGASSTGSRDHSLPPSYFICPIFLEVMQDPVVAADGYTYEAEALKGWLENGHDTSPMTNLRLSHSRVVPNHSLRSAIQEWLPHH